MKTQMIRLSDFELSLVDLTECRHLPEDSFENYRIDCFLICLGIPAETSFLSDLANWVVSLNCDWVQCFGNDAETLHDLVDQAAVASGRQKHVGDGNPMTSWESAELSNEQIMKQVLSGGFGFQSQKVVVVFGDAKEANRFAAGLRASAH